MSRVFIQHGECAAIARMLAVVAACSKPLPSSLFFLLFLLVDLLFWGSRGQVGGFLLDFSRSSTFITPARSTYSRVIFRHSPTVNVWLSLSATVDVAVDVTVAAAAAAATALPPTTPPPQLIPARILRCKRGEWVAHGRHLGDHRINAASSHRDEIA